MGFLSSITGRFAARRARSAQESYQRAYMAWKTEADKIDEYIAVVRDCADGRVAEQLVDQSDYGFIFNEGELPVAYLPTSLFLEVVRSPAKYSGGYGGVSFPLFGRVRVNTGRTGGKITPGEESVTTTDEGATMITTERIMFTGGVRTREWKFSRMLSITHHPSGYSVFATSGNAKPAGIAFGPDVATEVQFRIELAAAIARNRLPQYLAEIEAEKSHHLAEMPVPPPPAAV